MKDPDLADWAASLRSGSRLHLARAITLVESTRPADAVRARELTALLRPYAGGARRVGITGVPGVGKSTFVDALGSLLTAAGHRVAVLAVDPSSARVGGSILGDQTRMARLSRDPAAYVRPSPTRGTLGGVARATRENIVLVEAAGYDVVLVETVGVGQSETTVADLVDTFMVLTVARTGDQLQGIKKGVLELADLIVVNKADGGPHTVDAKSTARELRSALRLTAPADPSAWRAPVLLCSALHGDGVAEVWQRVLAHLTHLGAGDALTRRRADQRVAALEETLHRALLTRLATHPGAGPLLEKAREAARADTTPVETLVEDLLTAVWPAGPPH